MAIGDLMIRWRCKSRPLVRLLLMGVTVCVVCDDALLVTAKHAHTNTSSAASRRRQKKQQQQQLDGSWDVLHLPPPHPKMSRARRDAYIIPDEYLVVFTDDINDDDEMEHIIREGLSLTTTTTTAQFVRGRIFHTPLQAMSFRIVDDEADGADQAKGDDENNSEEYQGDRRTLTRFRSRRRSLAQQAGSLTHRRIRSESRFEALLDHPKIKLMEEVQEFGALFAEQRSPPSYGLDRIDQTKGLDDTYTYKQTGAGVSVYIMDTGIRVSHRDFGGRARCGFNYYGDPDTMREKPTCPDMDGHGTHTAGIVGGFRYGVAKEAEIISVRVLDDDGAGDTMGILAGIEYVALQSNSSGKAIICNMSLGGFIDVAISLAMQLVGDMNVVWVVAAGNSDSNACTFSPASSEKVLTVSATNITDGRADFANFGSCVDIFAPGADITSAWNENNFDSDSVSGTSMAAPHAAGVAAMYIQTYPHLPGGTIRQMIIDDAVLDVVIDPHGSPNRFLNIAKLMNDETVFAETPSPTPRPTSQSPTQVISYEPTRHISLKPSNVPTTLRPTSSSPSRMFSMNPSNQFSVNPSTFPTRHHPSYNPTHFPRHETISEEEEEEKEQGGSIDGSSDDTTPTVGISSSSAFKYERHPLSIVTMVVSLLLFLRSEF